MFRTRIFWAFSILAVISIIQGVLGWSVLKVADQNIQRGRIANELLSGFVDLSSNKNKLRIFLSESYLGRPINAEEFKTTQQSMVQNLDQLELLSQRAYQLQAGKPEMDEEHIERLKALRVLRLGVNGIGEQIPLFTARAESKQALSWQDINQVFDMAAGQDLRDLLASSISRERLATARDRAAADASIQQLNKLAVSATITVAMIAVLLALYFLRALSTPFRRISEGAKALESGNLDFRISETQNDEFSQLARAVNHMAKELSQFRGKEIAARAELEQLVRERTMEVQEGLHRMEKLDLRRRQMFADISHELKTPTTAIRGEAEIMLRGRDKTADEYKDSLSRVLDSSKHLGMVIEDMLTLSRSDIDSLVFDRRPVVLKEILLESIAQVQPFCSKKQIQIQSTLPSAALVLGDRQRLKQLFVIILDNAVQYSGTNTTITVATSEVIDEEHNPFCEIRICDSGMGISPEDQSKVWKRHYRSDKAKQIRADGQGLGLPLASAITRAHFGTILLESEEDVGTCVILKFPVFDSTMDSDTRLNNELENGLDNQSQQSSNYEPRS